MQFENLIRPPPQSRRTDIALSSRTCWCETVLSRTNASLCPEVVLFLCPLLCEGVLQNYYQSSVSWQLSLFFSVGRKFREFRVCSRTLKYFSLTRGLLCVSWFTPPSHHQMAVASVFARRTMQFLTTRLYFVRSFFKSIRHKNLRTFNLFLGHFWWRIFHLNTLETGHPWKF